MELAGIYFPEDFDKVRKALHRKRKRKMNSQWVPLKRKSKNKKIKPVANPSFNTSENKIENQNNELVIVRHETVLEPVDDLLKSDDETDWTENKTSDASEDTDADEMDADGDNLVKICDEGLLNSMKPCVVNLERLQDG